MSGVGTVKRGVKAGLSGVLFFLATGVHPAYATDMTAGVVLREMPSNEFVVYVAGIVEGLAYARFRKDSVAAGRKIEDGMQCIRDWYHNNPESILKVEEAFRQHDKYPPWVVLAAMIKKECGE